MSRGIGRPGRLPEGRSYAEAYVTGVRAEMDTQGHVVRVTIELGADSEVTGYLMGLGGRMVYLSHESPASKPKAEASNERKFDLDGKPAAGLPD